MELGRAVKLLASKNLSLEVFNSPFSARLVSKLFCLSKLVSGEDYQAFSRHCATVDCVHVFSLASGEMAGFQMWGVRNGIIRGGKLRLMPSARGTALPHVSGLVFLDSCKSDKELLRVSFASVFGFNSLAPSIASWRVLKASETGAVFAPCLEEGHRFAEENGTNNCFVFLF
jgi:hypothetical protein